ncbi:transposable element Tcb2 transposase [Trichonephila clavipes]|uniref:Transposable element Tcb2 transposase n=1 Tax=Trichonephila clavipes TaxID=2585209 RepID=A0A8X6W8B1_TRICX|nr:transposable element Tcb2 transposase [Trichonephila clavipes]
MRVWKQWTYEHQTTRKTGRGRLKVTLARDDRHLHRMTVNDGTASSRQLAARWSTATESLSQHTIDGCVYNRLMSTEPGHLIGTKLSFQMNHSSICWTMMTAFVLDDMPVNSTFQSASSNDIVA